MVRTKICGITSLEDSYLVSHSGSDAVGFLVGQEHQSNAFISPDLALEICKNLPPFLTSVMVTHLVDPDEIIHLARTINPRVIQLHSDLSIDTIKRIRSGVHQPLILKVSVIDQSALEKAQSLEPFADAILLDSIDLATDRVGGTGMVHDWTISKMIVESIQKPVILAGGLNPSNVKNAICKVQPWAVDVNSGVTRNGKKDKDLVTGFIRMAKN